MQPFQDLSKTGQFRRLAPLARRALLDYDLGGVSLSALQHSQNAIWRVQCGGDRPLAAEHEAYLDLFVLARWVFLGVCFLSRPEFRPYAPRFLSIVEPKIERYLRAAKSA